MDEKFDGKWKERNRRGAEERRKGRKEGETGG